MDTATTLTLTDGPSSMDLMMALFDTEHTRFVQFHHENEPLSSWAYVADHRIDQRDRKSQWVRVTSVKRVRHAHKFYWRVEGIVPLDRKRLPHSESQTFVVPLYDAHHRRGEAELGAEEPLCHQCGYHLNGDCRCDN